MKVGILTFHKAKNYGAVLQAFALLTQLKTLGLNPYIIDRYAVPRTWFHKVYFTLYPKHVLFRFSWIFFDKFARKLLLPLTQKYSTSSSLKYFNENENINIVIAGSDQVWRMEYSAIGFNYFFDFIKGKDVRKISYAASFGHDEWDENESVTTRVKQLLNEFDSISVREKSGVKICADVFNIHATNVLDPTLLLNKEVYEAILLDSKSEANNTLISYILDNNDAIKYCNLFAMDNGMIYSDLYYVYPFSEVFSNPKYGLKHYFHVSVPEWLSQIRDAKYLVTNSFHATVFAILFNKQFVVVDHPKGGTSRITSLLELLGLQDRFISEISEISLDLFLRKIDWNIVNIKLALEKERSIHFLKSSIS